MVEPILIQSLVTIRNEPYTLTLSQSHLTWEYEGQYNEPGNPKYAQVSGVKRVGLHEIIAVNTSKPSAHKCCGCFTTGEQTTQSECSGLSVYVITYHSKHRWRYRETRFTLEDEALCHKWITAIKDLLISPELKRPRRLIVFVNPYSGNKRSAKVYRKEVQPIFDLVEIQVEVIETVRAGQIQTEVEENLDLRKVDGLVCVGGDGTFAELVNGLLNRTARETGTAQVPNHVPVASDLRLGIIPAGSTDVVVYTTTGINDAVTSAIHIVSGQSIAIDVCAIYQNEHFLKYGFANLTYGYSGDVMRDSEKNRWMGPSRYNWEGFKKFVTKKSYTGELTYRLAGSTTNPTDGTRCRTGCCVCSSENEPIKDSNSDAEREICTIEDSNIWHTLRGRFVNINHVVIPWCCGFCPDGISPTCHLGDGFSDLVVTEECSRMNFLRFLASVASTDKDAFDFDFVKVFRINEFKFRTLPDKDANDSGADSEKDNNETGQHSVWNCDGEIIENPDIHVKVHRQVIKLFAHGIEDRNEEIPDSCCCSSG